MPRYDYYCSQCSYYQEVIHSMSECNSPSEKTLQLISCPDHGKMSRQISTPHLANMKGGVSVNERVLLKDKQAALKQRARSHTAQTLDTIKDPEVKHHLKKKYSSKEYKDLKDNPYAKK